MVNFLFQLFKPDGAFWVVTVTAHRLLPFVPIREILFFVLLSSQIIDAAVDADPVDPGGEAGLVFDLVFVQVVVRPDECFLQDVFGILLVFCVLVCQREDSITVLFKKHKK